jgi:hypothetical protein
MYSAQSLKREYGTLAQAKSATGLTARGWQALADKLNQPSPDAQIKLLQSQVKQLQQEIIQLKNLGNPIGFWLLDGNFDRSRFTDFDVPQDAFYKASIARKFHKELSRRYHPDKGGTEEQMANLNRLLDQSLALVEMNGGMAA